MLIFILKLILTGFPSRILKVWKTHYTHLSWFAVFSLLVNWATQKPLNWKSWTYANLFRLKNLKNRFINTKVIAVFNDFLCLQENVFSKNIQFAITGVYWENFKIFGPKQVGICQRILKKVVLNCSVDQERKYSKPWQTH